MCHVMADIENSGKDHSESYHELTSFTLVAKSSFIHY